MSRSTEQPSPSRAAIDNGLKIITDTFFEFRQELLDAFGAIESTQKKDGSSVTALDHKVEKVLRRRLLNVTPGIGFKGEETGRAGNDRCYWLVDPIDGTACFIRGVDRCTNMAALVVDGQTEAAVVYDFVRDRLYTARRGEGAYMNGQRLSVDDVPLAQSHVDNEVSAAYHAVYSVLRPEGVRILQPLGASGASFTDLATGRIQGVLVINYAAHEHDIRPGALIAIEAGAGFVGFAGESSWSPKTSSFAVATPTLVDFLQKSPLMRP